MAVTPLRSIIIAARVCAGIFAAAGLALYIIIFKKVTDDRFPGSDTGLTALPIGGAACSIFWNILALATVTSTRPLWCAFGDLAAAVFLTTLGAIGLRHDSITYLNNGMYLAYDSGPWLYQEVVGGSCLLASVVLQLFLFLLNVLENRRAKKPVMDGPSPPYTYGGGPYGGEKEKVEDIEVDWKSAAVSEEFLPSSVKRPEPAKA